jgi:hypothetical protein
MSARTRTILVWGLLVLGTVIVLVGSLTLWVKRQALDTDSWVNTSSELLENDDVRNALSIYIVDELYANLDPAETLADDLPPNLQGLAGPLAGALRQPAIEAVDRFLQRPRVQDLWARANRAAHEALLRVLEDETRAESVSTAGGNVTLDLRTLIVNIAEELGFGEQIESRLPEDAGRITVLRSDQLEAAQTGVKVIKALSWVIIFVALVLFAGAVYLARKRREMLRNVGAALLLVGILLLVIRRAVGNYIVDALSSGESVRDAIGSTWIIGTDLLAEVAWAVIIYGLVLLIGTVLAGPWGYFRRMRAWLAPNFRDRPEFGWAVLVVVYLLLILWGPVPALRNWIGVIVLGGLIALGFEAFRRIVLAEAEGGETGRLEPPPAPAA